MRLFFLIIIVFTHITSFAIGDSVYVNNIKSIKLSLKGDQLALPVYRLKSNDQLELMFDDMQQNVKNYFYTLQIVDINWEIFDINSFDYLSGFSQQKINNYKYSSLSLTAYTHYTVSLPDTKMMPKRSGNYILKVFLNSDTSQIIFTRRMFVLEQAAVVNASITQPRRQNNNQNFQWLTFDVKSLPDQPLNIMAQQVNVVVVQNNKWNEARYKVKPTFQSNNSLEFIDEDLLTFNAGKEWRWVNLKFIRLQTERVDSGIYDKRKTTLFLKPDSDRNNFKYLFYRDINGLFTLEADDGVEVNSQGDYATTHFYYDNLTKEMDDYFEYYLYGQLTDYKINENTKLNWDDDKKLYTTSMFLKQGFYNYTYLKINKKTGEISDTDGNYFETENNYSIFVYFKDFSDRVDRLISIGQINSRANRRGLGY